MLNFFCQVKDSKRINLDLCCSVMIAWQPSILKCSWRSILQVQSIWRKYKRNKQPKCSLEDRKEGVGEVAAELEEVNNILKNKIYSNILTCYYSSQSAVFFGKSVSMIGSLIVFYLTIKSQAWNFSQAYCYTQPTEHCTVNWWYRCYSQTSFVNLKVCWKYF